MWNVCLKTNRKRSALTRVAKFAPFKKRRILCKTFNKSQHKYYPLIWIFLGKQINDKKNKLLQGALRIVHNDTVTSFENYLLKDKSFTIYHQNIQS